MKKQVFCFAGLFFRWINSLIFITGRPYELPHWQHCGAAGHGVGQEQLQGVSGRGGGNGNMKFICCYTYCNFKPQPLAVFSWVTVTKKAKILIAFSPFAAVPFRAPYSPLLALLLNYWPSSSLLQRNLSSTFVWVHLTHELSSELVELCILNLLPSAQISARFPVVAGITVFQTPIFLLHISVCSVRKKPQHHTMTEW